MKHIRIIDLLENTKTLQEVNAKGWVRTFRNNQFIALNDGSTLNNIQCVVDFENTPEETLKRITTGAAISVTGTLVESQGAGQKVEIQVAKLEILGDSDAEKFPIQPKNKPSLDFLRENAHLRTRTNMFGAIMRVRSTLSFAVHKYFQEKGFVYVNTPIITGSDAEGAGEMFQVSALPFDNTPRTEDGKVNYKDLPLPSNKRPDLINEFVSPRDEFEKVITAIWEKNLGLTGIGVLDSFFNLGGSSLLAIKTVIELNAKFQKNLSVVHFFSAPTIEQLAKIYSGKESTQKFRKI